jgi:hypothetical protein
MKCLTLDCFIDVNTIRVHTEIPIQQRKKSNHDIFRLCNGNYENIRIFFEIAKIIHRFLALFFCYIIKATEPNSGTDEAIQLSYGKNLQQ